MSDVSKLGNSLSRTWHDFLGWVRGKAQPTLQKDAADALATMQRIGAGLSGASGDVPGIVADVEALIPAVAAAAAARGLNLPEDAAVALALKKAAADLERAYADYCAAATPVVTAVPVAPPSKP